MHSICYFEGKLNHAGGSFKLKHRNEKNLEIDELIWKNVEKSDS